MKIKDKVYDSGGYDDILLRYKSGYASMWSNDVLYHKRKGYRNK
jgi:hypothetical protein